MTGLRSEGARENQQEAVRAERRLRLRQLTECIEAAYKMEGVSFINQQGELLGLGLGVKPGVLLAYRPNRDLINTFLRRERPDLQLMGNILVNIPLLEERLTKERAFAEALGWDSEKSLEANVETLSGVTHAENTREGLTGFVLGFPEKAIRDFERMKKLQERGIPRMYNFFVDQNTPRTKFLLSEHPWTNEDLGRLELLRAHYKFFVESTNSLSGEIYAREKETTLFAPHRETLRLFYATHFSLTEEETNLLLYEKTIKIDTPNEDAVYTFFMSFTGEEPEEIAALRGRVAAAFKEIT